MVSELSHPRTLGETAEAAFPGVQEIGSGADSRPFAAERHWVRPALIGVTLVLAAVLFFTRLGHYGFWDDEAATALGAKAILQTGRNTALIDHGNIVAYRNGSALQGFDNRLEPLFPPYLTAATFAVFGANTWAGRFPFALFGLGTVALMLFWARRESWQTLAVLGIAILGNVSLFLYARNCRYYAPTIFFSVALAYLYRHRKPTVGSAAAFAALSILLFASNYLDHVALYVCLYLDYLLWQRRQTPLGWRVLLTVFLPQAVFIGAVALFWNPLSTAHGAHTLHSSLQDKWTLFQWQWRDTNISEQLCLPLLLVTALVAVTLRRPLLLRGCVGLFVYVVVVTLLSPQVVADGGCADVRYLTPLIPLAIGLEAATLCLLLRRWSLPLVATALFVFGTNFLNVGLLYWSGVRSTLVSYVRELADPLEEPFGTVADWINANVAEGQTVLVAPDYATYPLMFQAPKALYAWQLNWPPRPEYASLPPIHFARQVAPDYLVAYGPYTVVMQDAIMHMKLQNTRYDPVATVRIFWRHTNRPEVFWHRFEPVVDFDPFYEAIHIYKRVAVEPGPDGQPGADRPFPALPRRRPEPVTAP